MEEIDKAIDDWRKVDCTKVECQDCNSRGICLLYTSLSGSPAMRGLDHWLGKECLK